VSSKPAALSFKSTVTQAGENRVSVPYTYYPTYPTLNPWLHVGNCTKCGGPVFAKAAEHDFYAAPVVRWACECMKESRKKKR
jgi:hypothetical protein